MFQKGLIKPRVFFRGQDPPRLLHMALPHFSSGTRAPCKQQVLGTLHASGPGTWVERLHESTKEWEQRPVFRAQRPRASRNATVETNRLTLSFEKFSLTGKRRKLVKPRTTFVRPMNCPAQGTRAPCPNMVTRAML